MTNFQRWQLITRDFTSPQSFIDFGFYYLIGAALERRVWFGGDNPNIPGQIYCNNYTVLIGPPGVGKSRVTILVNEMLRFWRKDLDSGKIEAPPEDREMTASKENYLFPAGPKTITYEALTDTLANSYRRVNYIKPGTDGLKGIYGHSSMFFALSELSSLMQREAHKIAEFLLDVYDCDDIQRKTKTQGVDNIRKPCMSLLAGTTPAFLEETLKEKLLSDGFSARVWFIYEYANRFDKWDVDGLDAEQQSAKVELLEHLKYLALLYGRVTLSPEAEAYMKQWWEIDRKSTPRPNLDIRLDPYYSRKLMHVRKLAAILHFAEQFTSFVIPLETCKAALTILNKVEQRMHYALVMKERNPLAAVGRKIVKYLDHFPNGQPKNALLAKFYEDVTDNELTEVLNFLIATRKVKPEGGKYYSISGLIGEVTA